MMTGISSGGERGAVCVRKIHQCCVKVFSSFVCLFLSSKSAQSLLYVHGHYEYSRGGDSVQGFPKHFLTRRLYALRHIHGICVPKNTRLVSCLRDLLYCALGIQ